MDIKWKYKIDLKDGVVFSEIEKDRGIIIPMELKELIKNSNAATPSKYNFMVGTNEKVLGAILSFNKKDDECVDSVFTALQVIKDKYIVPFGIDPFGNYICYDVKKNVVVFWNHENDKVISLDKNIQQFLESLY